MSRYYDFSDPFCYGKNQKSTLCMVDLEVHSLAPAVLVREETTTLLLHGVGVPTGGTLAIGTLSAALTNITRNGTLWSANVSIPSNQLTCGMFVAMVTAGSCYNSRNVSVTVVTSTTTLSNSTGTFVPVNTSVAVAMDSQCLNVVTSAACVLGSVSVPATLHGSTQLVCDDVIFNTTGLHTLSVAFTVPVPGGAARVVRSNPVNIAAYGMPQVMAITPDVVADDAVPMFFNVSGTGFAPVAGLRCTCTPGSHAPALYYTPTGIACPMHCLAKDPDTLTPQITQVTIEQGIFVSPATAHAWITVAPGNVSASASYVTQTAWEGVEVGAAASIGIVNTLDSVGMATTAPASAVQVEYSLGCT